MLIAVALVATALGAAFAAEPVEVAGVTFPAEKTVAGKTLTLNGVAVRKALGFLKVYVAGLYLENPSDNAGQIIASEQIKYLHTHYLSSMVTKSKLQNGFIDLMESCNPPEMVERNRKDIDLYASWLDKDMKPGLTSASTYIPGKGLTLEFQGEVRGTIANPEFATMYYNYNIGPKAEAAIRDALLGK